MPDIAPVGVLTALALRQEYQVKAVALVKDALELEGAMAVKLITAATAAADTGRHLDVLA